MVRPASSIARPASAIETVKLPWRVGHDLYGGGLQPETAEQVVDNVRKAARQAAERQVAGLLAIATGVFRELPELDELAQRIETETGVRPRVISGQDEAALMARGFRELRLELLRSGTLPRTKIIPAGVIGSPRLAHCCDAASR